MRSDCCRSFNLSAFEFSAKINFPALAARVGGAIHDTLLIMQVVSGDVCLNISNDETLTAMEEIMAITPDRSHARLFGRAVASRFATVACAAVVGGVSVIVSAQPALQNYPN